MKTSLSQTLCPECDEVLSVSDSVRLVGGSGLCSGSLQIWDRSWISVCEGALDLRGAEVLCRELGCNAPSVLQGELSPLGQTFHCEGHESALVDCPRSRPKTCPSGPSEDVICSEPLRLVGGASRCAGTVEVSFRGEWRRVRKREDWTEEDSAAVCRDLDCGSAVSGRHRDGFPHSPLWMISADCMKRRTTKLRECVYDYTYSSSWFGVEVMCSDLLNRPVLSLSVTVGASQVQVSQVQVSQVSQVQVSQVQDSQVQDSQVQVSQVGVQVVRVQLGSQFSVQCSVKPQFPGGSFQLLSPSGNHTLPAVNHSAHFLFNHTGPAHKGDYTCVYHLQVFGHSFTSESERLELRLGVQRFNPIIRVLIILLMTLLFILPLCYYCYKVKSRRGASETHETMILMNEVITEEERGGDGPEEERGGDGPGEERGGDGPGEERGGDGPGEERGGDGPEEERGGDGPGEERGGDGPGEERGGDGPGEERGGEGAGEMSEV
uniref:SRCR domain-containing protein n=1 Tax=Knipowitschia caucasica TaxID=637954 RepID=A0AAV2LJQ4_KNICA